MKKYDWSGVIACARLAITTAAAFIISFWMLLEMTNFDFLKIFIISAVFIAPVAAFIFVCANEKKERK